MTLDRQISRPPAPPSASPAEGGNRPPLGPALQLAVLLGSWAALHRASIGELLATASGSALHTGALVAAALIALVVHRGCPWPSRPVPRPGPLLVVALCVGLHLGPGRLVDSGLLSCMGMVVGAWGLTGLFLDPDRWRGALPLALAAVCVLPMGPALDIYLGFPLRLATAHLVHATLEPLGLSPTTAETIVLVEGTGVQIDLPCSGVRSLWSGALLWTAATWIERRRVGAAWLVAGLGFATVLVVLNGLRVLVLVLLHGAGASAAMELLHVPLGLVAFGTAAALGWIVLQRLPRAPEPRPVSPAPHRARWPWGLAAGLLALAALASMGGSSETSSSTAPRTIVLAHDPTLEPIALRPDEARLFARRHAQAAGKWRIDGPAGRGQMVMVQGSAWRSQHRPDICHQANGRTVEREDPVLLAPGIPARQLRLAQGDHEAVAYYWFQSAERTTNEYGTRIWAALDGDPEPWMMVSVMLDTPRTLDDPEVRALLLRAHAHAHALLTHAPTSPP